MINQVSLTYVFFLLVCLSSSLFDFHCLFVQSKQHRKSPWSIAFSLLLFFFFFFFCFTNPEKYGFIFRAQVGSLDFWGFLLVGEKIKEDLRDQNHFFPYFWKSKPLQTLATWIVLSVEISKKPSAITFIFYFWLYSGCSVSIGDIIQQVFYAVSFLVMC